MMCCVCLLVFRLRRPRKTDIITFLGKYYNNTSLQNIFNNLITEKNIYFLLRFGLANAITDYYRLKISVVYVCNENKFFIPETNV